MLFQFLHTLLEVRLQFHLMQIIVVLSMIKPVEDTVELKNGWFFFCFLFKRRASTVIEIFVIFLKVRIYFEIVLLDGLQSSRTVARLSLLIYVGRATI